MKLETLDLQQRMISLEASTLSNTITAVTDRLPGFIADVNSFLAGLVSIDKANNSQLLGDRDAHLMVKNTRYTDLMPLMVYTPPGLSVTYTELVKVLDKGERISSAILKETLAPFSKWIAVQLANPQKMISITSANIPGIKLHDIEGITKELSNCFKNSTAQTEAKFADAFKRVADFEQVAKDLNSINDAALHTTPKAMKAAIEELVFNLDKLVQRVQADPESYSISGPVIKTLAGTAYAIAKECEFYSVFMYQLKSTVQAFRDTEEAMEREIPAINDTSSITNTAQASY